jgi:hypothetical protein
MCIVAHWKHSKSLSVSFVLQSDFFGYPRYVLCVFLLDMYQGSFRDFYQFVLRLLSTMKLSRHFIFIVIKAIFIFDKNGAGITWNLKNRKSLNFFFETGFTN